MSYAVPRKPPIAPPLRRLSPTGGENCRRTYAHAHRLPPILLIYFQSAAYLPEERTADLSYNFGFLRPVYM